MTVVGDSAPSACVSVTGTRAGSSSPAPPSPDSPVDVVSPVVTPPLGTPVVAVGVVVSTAVLVGAAAVVVTVLVPDGVGALAGARRLGVVAARGQDDDGGEARQAGRGGGAGPHWPIENIASRSCS